MKIVSRRGGPGGGAMELVVVDEGDRYFVYFSPVGAARVQPNAPHFVVGRDRSYGDLKAKMEYFRNAFDEFVCPDFAGHEELKALRAENDNLKRSQVSEQELEDLRADRAELERMRLEEREATQLKARLVELLTRPALCDATSGPWPSEANDG